MLHHSLYGPTDSDSPPSPQRRLEQPVRHRENSSSPGQTAYVDSPPTSPSPPTGISAPAFSPDYFKRCYKVEKELGRGGKGVVFLVTHVLDGVPLGQHACKRVPVGDDHTWLENVLREVQILQWLSDQHKHLVSYRHVWLEDVKLSNFGPSVPCAFILQQYCNSGTLQDYVFNQAQTSTSTDELKERVRRHSKNRPELPRDVRGRKLSFDQIYSFFKDITSGLNHLHLNGYIHRDLKPSNCLLHDTGDGLRVLVSDFGEVQAETMIRRSTGATGTLSYCAPEVLRRQPGSEAYGNFTFKSDIFSLGMILYFLCFARLPYRNADILNEEEEDLDQLREEITTWTGLQEERRLRPDLPEQLYTFLRRLLSRDPNERPSAEDILLGIKTGAGLDEISDTRPRPASHMFDDLRGSSRISPIDSPKPSTPARKMSAGYVRSGKPAKLRLSSFQKEQSSSSTPNESTPTETDSEQAISPGGSLVLRERFPSPKKTREMPQLPAPAPKRTPSRLSLYLHSHATQRVLKIVLLLLKVVSINLLCTPMASNPMVSYPLFALAALDILLNTSRPALSILLVIFHVFILLSAAKTEVLCMTGMRYWKDF